MNANAELIIDLDQWLLENTREPKAPFRSGSPLHRLNIQSGHFYKEIGSCVTYQGRELKESSLVHTMYDPETLTRIIGAAVYLTGERLVIGQEGIIAFNMDAPSKQFVVACLATEALKLAETGYPVICASVESLHLTLSNDIAILDGVELFRESPVAEMTPQAMRTIINNAFAEVKQANIQEQEKKQAELAKVESQSCPVMFDKLTPFPEVNGSGKPTATIENVEELLQRMGATVRYNVIKKDIEINIPGHSSSRDNRLVSNLAEIISHCNRVGLPTGNIEGFITRIADKNQYNPVLTWITSKPWDGVKRWDEFCNTVTPKTVKLLPNGTPLHTALIKRWMVSAIAAASRDGTSLHGVLVLQGDQGLGKTSWLKSLAPTALNVVKDGLSLNPDNKDSVKKVISYWLVELGEVNGTLRKADQESLKAFLTKDSDEIRLPYARAESDFGRRTAFFGSVNDKSFLRDDSGSRRWWVIECERVNYQHTFDTQQVWAEVLDAYEAGMQWHLTLEELDALNANNEEFQVIDPIEERILSKLDWSSSLSTWRWATATEILMEIGIDRPSGAEAKKASACIKKHNGDQTKRSHGKNLLLAPSAISFMSDNYNRPY